MLVSAVAHETGVVLGQESVTENSNEIPAVRQLIAGLELQDKVVTLDAPHTQRKTALAIMRQGADYVMTVKGNQATMRGGLDAINWDKPEVCATEYRTLDKGHGRVETRWCRCVDLQGAQWDGFVKLPHRRQAVRCVRERYEVKTGKTSIKTVYAVTSLSPQQATCEHLLALLRGHGTIENRLHHVHDVSYDEDRCRAHKGQLPQNLASLSNAAISIVRHQARFHTLPPANRYYAGHPDEALAAVLRPLTI